MKIEHIDEVKRLAEGRSALSSERRAFYGSRGYYIQYCSFDENRREHLRFGCLKIEERDDLETPSPRDFQFFNSVKLAIDVYFEAGIAEIDRRLAELGVTV